MVDVLERGDLFFLYRPTWREEAEASGRAADRLYLVLSPDGDSRRRLVSLGRPRLPRGEPSPHRPGKWCWAVVDEVTDRPEELVRVLEDRALAAGRPAPRPAGEGRYALVDHGDHTHFAYHLDLPKEPGPVQQELGIGKERSYTICVLSPEAPSRLDVQERPVYPPALMERFQGRRLAPANDPRFLDFENTELLLAGPSDHLDWEVEVPVDAERVEARYERGLLRITLPKRGGTR